MESLFSVLKMLWTVMTTITMAPVGIYMTIVTYSPKFLGFLFISSEHAWWHNLILGLILFAAYGLLCMIFVDWLKSAYAKHSEIVSDKYGVQLISFTSIMCYIMAPTIPLMTLLPAFAVPEDYWWVGLAFVLLLWIYYLIKARLGIFSILLRQLYLFFVFFLTVSIMFLPAIAIFVFQALLGAGGSSAQDSRHQEHITRTTTTYEDGSQSTEESRNYY